jgi:hypothetical protein
MNNADKPAMPTSPNESDPEWAAARTGGLTKREQFTMAAMQALISGLQNEPITPSLIAALNRMSVKFADGQLEELAE